MNTTQLYTYMMLPPAGHMQYFDSERYVMALHVIPGKQSGLVLIIHHLTATEIIHRHEVKIVLLSYR